MAFRFAIAACGGVLRIENEQLGLRYLHVGEAEVESGAQLLVGERADLLAGGLARGDGLLRHLEHRLRGERLVEGLIDRERDVFDGGSFGFQLRLGVGLRALDKVVGAAEVGDELAER